MKLVVLTTDTLHHCYFVRELDLRFAVEAVFIETNSLKPQFDIAHSFEADREVYEQRIWFDEQTVSLADIAPVKRFNSINDSDAIKMLKQLAPDVVVVFGTGKLSREVINICPDGMLNLHGGDPELDRGLDTHLWAIYENRFDALITTLHRINDQLDDGEVVSKAPIQIEPNMQLHQLRKSNTEVCLELVLNALKEYEAKGCFTSKPQLSRGRYYSFMPTEKKSECQQKFKQFASKLK